MKIYRWSSKIYEKNTAPYVRWTVPSTQKKAIAAIGYEPQAPVEQRQQSLETLATCDKPFIPDQTAAIVADIYLHDTHLGVRNLAHSMLDSYSKTGDFTFSIPAKKKIAELVRLTLPLTSFGYNPKHRSQMRLESINLLTKVDVDQQTAYQLLDIIKKEDDRHVMLAARSLLKKSI